MKKNLPITKKETKSHESEDVLLKVYYVVVLLISIILTSVFSTNVKAEEITPSSQSMGIQNKKMSNEERRKIIDNFRVKPALSDQILGKSLGKTRNEILSEKDNKMRKSLPSISSKDVYISFSFYDAYNELYDDLDGDGYFQTFNVVFDADVNVVNGVDQANVYAELYLSRDGGPWLHYYRTDNFTIYGDSDLDEYEVLTNLTNGYPSDHYDVLIDLYEVGYSDIVATVSADDINGLYALPLESDDFDYYEEQRSHSHGGSISLTFLFYLLLILFMRKITSQQTYSC